MLILPSRRMAFGRAAALFLIAVSVTVFVVRGPYRAVKSAIDYAVVYAEGRAWLAGGNPYDFATFASAYDRSGAPARFRPHKGFTDSINSPTLLPLIALTAWPPWTAALAAWLALSIGAYAGACVLLARSVTDWPVPTRAGILSVALCFSPVLAGISTGQTSVLASASILLAFTPALNRMDTARGVLLGLAICLKPQLGLLFLLVPLRKRNWRMIAVTVAVTAAIAAVALVPLMRHSPGWLSSLLGNLELTMTNGSTNDASPANPDAWKLLNLQSLLLLFMPTRTLATIVTMGLVSIALGVWWKYSSPMPSEPYYSRSSALLCLSSLTLLFTYHRNYDATLLVFGLPAIVLLWRKRPYAAAMLGTLLLPFTVPLPAYLALHWPGAIHMSYGEASSVLKAVLLRHQVLLLVAIALAGLYVMKASRSVRG